MNSTHPDMMDVLESLDQQFFLALNGEVSPLVDQVMFYISEKYVWIPFYLMLLWFLIRRFRWNAIWIALGAILLITLTDQFSNVLKDGVKRFRPCKDPEIAHLVHIVNNYCRSSYGFVSAHAANSMALAILISLLFRNKWVTVGMILWAVIVSFSRIYLGVHFPGDVIGGWILGWIFSFLIYILLKRLSLLKDTV